MESVDASEHSARPGHLYKTGSPSCTGSNAATNAGARAAVPAVPAAAAAAD
jgi:hypothetical protein